MANVRSSSLGSPGLADKKTKRLPRPVETASPEQQVKRRAYLRSHAADFSTGRGDTVLRTGKLVLAPC